LLLLLVVVVPTPNGAEISKHVKDTDLEFGFHPPELNKVMFFHHKDKLKIKSRMNQFS